MNQGHPHPPVFQDGGFERRVRPDTGGGAGGAGGWIAGRLQCSVINGKCASGRTKGLLGGSDTPAVTEKINKSFMNGEVWGPAGVWKDQMVRVGCAWGQMAGL